MKYLIVVFYGGMRYIASGKNNKRSALLQKRLMQASLFARWNINRRGAKPVVKLYKQVI